MNNEEKILSILETMQTDMADLKDRVVKIEITQENIVIPQLQALAEGHRVLLETLAPKSRVETLEEEVAFLKEIIRTHAAQINELKKAQ